MPNNVTKPPILDGTGQTIKQKLSAILQALQSAGNNFIPMSQKGAASGVAELDANGKVPSSQLPSYVDDVLEYSSTSAFPQTGETGKIYIATDTNKSYRWSGSTYVEISSSLALGETSSTAYRGDRGKVAYDSVQGLQYDHKIYDTRYHQFNMAVVENNKTITEITDDISDRLEESINDHAALFSTISGQSKGSYYNHSYNASSHSFDNIAVETDKTSVYMAGDINDKMTNAINDHATLLTKDAYQTVAYDDTTHKMSTHTPISVNASAISMVENVKAALEDAVDDHADLIDAKPDDLAELGDVSVVNPTNGQILKYNATSQKWENGTGGSGGASALNDLSDVAVSSPQNNELLAYNSTAGEWQNGRKIQSNASATAFNALDIPDGQTIQSVLNTKIVSYKNVPFPFNNSKVAALHVGDIDSNLPRAKFIGINNATSAAALIVSLNGAKTHIQATALDNQIGTIYANILAIY